MAPNPPHVSGSHSSPSPQPMSQTLTPASKPLLSPSPRSPDLRTPDPPPTGPAPSPRVDVAVSPYVFLATRGDRRATRIRARRGIRVYKVNSPETKDVVPSLSGRDQGVHSPKINKGKQGAFLNRNGGRITRKSGVDMTYEGRNVPAPVRRPDGKGSAGEAERRRPPFTG